MIIYEQLLKLLIASPELRVAVQRTVARAFAEPRAFYNVPREYRLAERGLTFSKSSALTPKFVFIDTLLAHNILAEVAWKASEEEVRQAVRASRQARQFTPVVEATERYENELTHEVIYRLAPTGCSLPTLDSNADCYEFTSVPRAAAMRVQALFRQL